MNTSSQHTQVCGLVMLSLLHSWCVKMPSWILFRDFMILNVESEFIFLNVNC